MRDFCLWVFWRVGVELLVARLLARSQTGPVFHQFCAISISQITLSLLLSTPSVTFSLPAFRIRKFKSCPGPFPAAGCGPLAPVSSFRHLKMEITVPNVKGKIKRRPYRPRTWHGEAHGPRLFLPSDSGSSPSPPLYRCFIFLKMSFSSCCLTQALSMRLSSVV